MDFHLSEKTIELQARLTRFMEAHILPAEQPFATICVRLGINGLPRHSLRI